ncbi:DUF6567 family protein [Fodinibius salsisoli]|uniref:Uncharacterized protein n=1 Tax=Fodinibius salsisoli TaxID=2820877 RepID=A0ABT3PM59_9BACT|nr:DUF6567 family protein [Fodinibius salsisoli]MCW9707040.1 hypothetical protein [Fodinibius salsisoli]
MERLYTHILLVIISLSIVIGCASSGAFNTANITETQLSEDNYNIVATDITGQSSAGYILGVSGDINQQVRTFALARVSGSGMLYGEAINDLWGNFREKYGDVEGRNLALINVRYDTESLNLLLYTKPTVSVRADVIEFDD